MFCGHVAIVIRGYFLEKEKIDRQMGIQATRFSSRKIEDGSVDEGKIFNAWSYEVRYDDRRLDEAIRELAAQISNVQNFLQETSLIHEVYLTIFIQSDYAQITHIFPPEILKLLSEMNLKTRLSIFSWGGADDV